MDHMRLRPMKDVTDPKGRPPTDNYKFKSYDAKWAGNHLKYIR